MSSAITEPQRFEKSGRAIELECTVCGSPTTDVSAGGKCPICSATELRWRLKAASGKAQPISVAELATVAKCEQQINQLASSLRGPTRDLPLESTAALQSLRQLVEKERLRRLAQKEAAAKRAAEAARREAENREAERRASERRERERRSQIQAGRWRFVPTPESVQGLLAQHGLDPSMLQLFGSMMPELGQLVNSLSQATQEYNLHPGDRMDGRYQIQFMGSPIWADASGTWGFNQTNRVLLLNGKVQLNLGVYGGTQIQPFQWNLQILAGEDNHFRARDLNTNVVFDLHRL